MLIAAVWRGCQQEQVASSLFSQPFEQGIALVPALATALGAGVGFVYDHEIWAAAEEFVPATVGFYVVQADHRVRVVLEQGFAL